MKFATHALLREAMAGATGLLPFLDIVRAAAHLDFRWSATEVGTAFQWANRVQDLPTATAASVSAALEVS